MLFFKEITLEQNKSGSSKFFSIEIGVPENF